MLLYTWVTLASVVRRSFYKLLGSVSSLSYCRWDHEAWGCTKSMGCMYLIVHCEFFSLSETIPPFVFRWLRVCLRVSCYKPCWLGMINTSSWLIDCPCVFKGLYPLLCVCFELAYAHGDSLDESKLLFWNKLVQCDLEPETCVVILAECCRWPL